MATKPTDTARLFALTSSSACFVTLTQDGRSHTWQALPDNGGQTTFIIPAGAVAELSDEKAHLSPLPFKVAPGTGGVGGYLETEIQNLIQLATSESAAVLSSLSWPGLCGAANSEWLKSALRSCVHGDTAYIDLSSCTPPAVATPTYNTTDTPLLSGENGQLRLGKGVEGLKRMVLKISQDWRYGNTRTLVSNPDVDFIIITKTTSLDSFAYMGRGELTNYQAKSLTLVYPSYEGSTSFPIGTITTNYLPTLDESQLSFPIRFIAPALTKAVSFKVNTWQSGAWEDDKQTTHLDISAALPRYVSSFDFYKSNLNSVSNLIFLMDNLGEPTGGSLPQLQFGLSAALVTTDGDTPVYTDAALQAAIERLRAKGWEDMPIPLIEL